MTIQWQTVNSQFEGMECIICTDHTPPMLAHPGNNGAQLYHLVHKKCLLQWDKSLCPQCRAPYNRDQFCSWENRCVRKIKYAAQDLADRFGRALIGTYFVALRLIILPFFISVQFNIGVILGTIVYSAALSASHYLASHLSSMALECTNFSAERREKLQKVAIYTNMLATTILSFYALKHFTIARFSPAVQKCYSRGASNSQFFDGVYDLRSRIEGFVVSAMFSFFLAGLSKEVVNEPFWRRVR